VPGPLRIAVLVKQIPKFESMELGPDGRLVRDGLELEMNAYCRRAVAQGVTLARETGGATVVFTMGPPSADDVLREAIAWGADEGVLLTDGALAGADTLATSRALVAALRREGPFDLILMGRNSVDADTGQVPPEVASLLDLPFVAGVRELEIDGDEAHVRLEHDDEWVRASVTLPAVMSVAERLCDPAKVPPEGRAEVDDGRIRRLGAADLGPGQWGTAGSPTRVGEVRVLDVERLALKFDGPVDAAVDKAMQILVDRGVLEAGNLSEFSEQVVAHTAGAGPAVGVLVEPDRGHMTRELLGAAARLAEEVDGRVIAVGPEPGPAMELSRWGAHAVVAIDGAEVEEDVASAAYRWADEVRPWAILAPGTAWGREVAARVAARLGAGLTGDAVGLAVDEGRLLAWKPAFGGRMVAAIRSVSDVQMVTVRAGVLPLYEPRPAHEAPVSIHHVAPRGRVRVLTREREDNADLLANAEMVVGVGLGVDPTRYHELDPLVRALGAELAATRKVTDQGWLPRARQVGITGHSISPRLFVSIGASGKFNHTVGLRSAGTILAINADPDALVWDCADVGIVGDWGTVVPVLAARLTSQLAGDEPVVSGDGTASLSSRVDRSGPAER
jgi:electron transfer flavoprotein alpha subunit